MKRKLESPKDPTEIYKSAKVSSTNGDARRTFQASIDTNDGIEAGPELPPDSGDEEDSDEEGRFFGGGISQNTQTVLDFVNEQEEDNAKAEAIDSAWLKKTALDFEKKISKNAELRAKYDNEPQKFITSEGDLDSSIKALSILSENADLYAEFAELGCVGSLVSLLSHENTDIAIDTIEIISELIDQDVEAEPEQWDALVNALLDADLVDLLYANLSRLDEKEETDRNGVYHILEVIESLGSKAEISDKLGKHESIIPWLLARSTSKEAKISQNKQYAAEVLSILLQSSSTCRAHFTRTNGVDLYLQALSTYRKHDPEKDSEEEEFVENLFDSLACILDEPRGKAKFLEAEGIELCLILIKQNKPPLRRSALKLLDHTTSGFANSTTASCTQIIHAAGLKPLCTIFMKQRSSTDAQTTEHLLDIFLAMLNTLPSESAPRIRLLGKFIEKDYEKISRLLQLRTDYTTRLAAVDAEIALEEAQSLDRAPNTNTDLDLRGTWFSRRLDAGLFSLQTVDTILAWLVAEDDGARRMIVAGLGDKGLAGIRETLVARVEGMDSTTTTTAAAADDDDDDDEEEEKGQGEMVREILDTLIGVLV